MTRDLRVELIDTVYQHYPRGLLEAGEGYHDTAEHQRLLTAARRGAAEYPTWEAMLRRIGEEDVFDSSVRILGGWREPAYSAELMIPGNRTLGFHVSLLGPYYGIHRTGAPDEEPSASKIAREIEATYRGYVEIPPEIGDEVVPDISLKMFGETTIYHCILSEEWDLSSHVLPERVAPLPEVDPSEEAEEEPLEPDERRPPNRPTTTIYIVQRRK